MVSKNVVTTSRIDHPVNIFFDKKFLKVLEALLVFERFGQDASLPMHEGDTYKWRLYDELAVATTPLDEVVGPGFILPSKNDLSVQMKQYGSGMKVSAWRDMVGLSQDKAAMTERLARQSAKTLDTLIRNVTAGGASSTTCSNGSPTATFLNNTDILTVIRNLMSDNAEMMTALISAAVGQGTTPIAPSYMVITHTDLYLDIRNVAGFVEVKNYAKTDAAYPGEVGAIGPSRWILTTNAYKSGSNYYCLFLAQDAFGKVKIAGGDRPLIFHPPDKTGDAFEMYSTLCWKLNRAYKILQDVLLHSLICTKRY